MFSIIAKSPVAAQNFAKSLFQEPLFDSVISMTALNLSSKIRIDTLLSDSLKENMLPFRIYGQMRPEQALFLAKKFPVGRIYFSVDNASRISACLFLFKRHYDGLVKSIVEKIGYPYSSFNTNINERMGIGVERKSYFWKGKSYRLIVWCKYNDEFDMIEMDNGKVEDFMITTF